LFQALVITLKLLHNCLIHYSSADNIDSALQHESRPLNKLVGDCHSTIQKGLGKSLFLLFKLLYKPHIQHLLGDVLQDNSVNRTVCMNYDNYECKIIEKFGMELIGWPHDLLPIRNPGQLGGHDRVQELLIALITKVCHWKKLSEEDRQRRILLNSERHARGEQVYKPRKKRTSQGTEKSTATITSDTNDNSNNSDGDEGDSAAW